MAPEEAVDKGDDALAAWIALRRNYGCGSRCVLRLITSGCGDAISNPRSLSGLLSRTRRDGGALGAFRCCRPPAVEWHCGAAGA
jgi:hypothetical protein